MNKSSEGSGYDYRTFTQKGKLAMEICTMRWKKAQEKSTNGSGTYINIHDTTYILRLCMVTVSSEMANQHILFYGCASAPCCGFK